MVKHGRFAAFYLFLFFLIGSNIDLAQAQTVRYVNRADATCGGQSPCYTTIHAAIDATGPGNTIRIQSGIYPEQLHIQKYDFPVADFA